MRFGIVLVLLAVWVLPQSAHAARIYLDPPNVTYGPGDVFYLQVRIDNDGECINAAQVEVRYPTESLRAVDFGRGGSIFTLWAQEPAIDTKAGVVTFAGGVPGGYCGRVPGDPVISNVLGKIVFTALSNSGEADIRIAQTSEVYLNDGTGSKAELEVQGSTILFNPTPLGTQNAWNDEVASDDIPPESFKIEVQSTRGVFGGKYYVVFSTVDKQSGLDHYEIYERGAWQTVSSPYQLKDQSPEAITLKAIDKAGNERMGEFDASAVPARETTLQDQLLVILGLLPLFIAGLIVWYRERRKQTELAQAPTGGNTGTPTEDPPPPQA